VVRLAVEVEDSVVGEDSGVMVVADEVVEED
jgi:hypothetical protein